MEIYDWKLKTFQQLPSLTSPPSHKRVLTIMASAIHTMPPCFLIAQEFPFAECPNVPVAPG